VLVYSRAGLASQMLLMGPAKV